MKDIEWRKLRMEAGLSQKKVADLAGICRPSYNHYENDKYVPNLYTAIDLLQVLGYKLKLERIAE